MTYAVTFQSPLSAEDKTLMAYLTGTGATAPVSAPDAFPADPTKASLSPENSSIMIFNGAIVGPPYLKDGTGAVWTLAIRTGSVPAFGMATRNNTPVIGGGSADGINQIIVRQGQVWCVLAGGQTQWFDPARGSLYNGAMPPAWTGTTTGGVPVPALPAMPTPSAVAPGSSGKIINCGSGQAIPTLTAAIATAAAGDTIRVARGSYTDTPPSWKVPLLIDGQGSTWNATGKTATLANGKALFCPAADSIIQGVTVTGVAMDQTEGQLTSAIRPETGCGYLTVKASRLTGNQCGVGEGGIGPCVIALDTCDISGNGLKANAGALTHNLYIGQDCIRLTLTNVISTNPSEAHAVKYRGPQLIVNGGTFASSPGKPFDLPNGCTVPFSITGATIIKNASDPDHGVLACGEEGATNGLAGGTINGGTIVAACPNPSIIGPGGTITLAGVTKTGNAITASGGVVLVG